ncbi:MAG: hypothetical protein R3D98_17220 [Candidatus Krumholzibacteriia bacterium]
MSYEQTFRPDLNLVYTRFGPRLSLEDARQCAVDTFRDVRYRAGMSELMDFRGLTQPDIRFNFETIHEIWETQATWIRELRRQAEVVMVARSDLVFGLLRIYASLAAEDGVRVTPCRDWNAACRLLALDPGLQLRERTAEA